jgi:hypothetical protein
LQPRLNLSMRGTLTCAVARLRIFRARFTLFLGG